MPDIATFALYLSAAFVLAITPGPGIFYVLTRSLKGGRREGYASAFGTAVGGLFHVVAAALGLSAILATSAIAFNIVKYVGAAYLIYLGIRTLLSKDEALDVESATHSKNNRAFYQGIVTEVLNPKTALFFLAFIPQFINPASAVVPQVMLLGCISVFLNTSVDVVVATMAGPIGSQLKRRAGLRKAQRMFSGGSLIALGTYVALSSGESQSSG
jgi:threonine/homoserine/homoserine lactone efflux protein